MQVQEQGASLASVYEGPSRIGSSLLTATSHDGRGEGPLEGLFIIF